MEARRWAAASARTLARRLRRQARDERGLGRSAALAVRTKAMRAALAAHWELGDALGWHPAAMGEALSAARLLKLPTTAVEAAEELCKHGGMRPLLGVGASLDQSRSPRSKGRCWRTSGAGSTA